MGHVKILKNGAVVVPGTCPAENRLLFRVVYLNAAQRRVLEEALNDGLLEKLEQAGRWDL